MEINKTFSHWTKIYDPDFLKVWGFFWKDGHCVCKPGSPVELDRVGSQLRMHRWGQNCHQQADERNAQVDKFSGISFYSEQDSTEKIVFSDHEKKVVVPVPNELALQGLLLVLDCHDSLPYTIVVELIEV